MSFSFRKLHNIISALYHSAFSDQNLYTLIDELDKLSSSDFIKIFMIDSINHLIENNPSYIIDKINYIEEKKIVDFCDIIKDIIFEKKVYRYYNISIFDEYINAIKSSSIINYYLIGFFYENYLHKYNKIINNINTINNQINNIVDESEIEDLKQKKIKIYTILINDFIIELVAKFYEDFSLRLLKNIFNVPDDLTLNNDIKLLLPFKYIYNLLNRSKELLNSHNENVKFIFS